MNLKFLGTADSGGIPTHNCTCLACEDYRKKGKRNLATCAYLECDDGQIILLDAGIENIATLFDGKTLKAIFLTHFHADHVLGLLRLRYSSDKLICYHPKDEQGFENLFHRPLSIEFRENTPYEPIVVNGLTFTPLPLKHSKNTTGYLIQSKTKTIAYLTDCSGLNKEVFQILKDTHIDECYLDACLAPNFSNGNHFNYEEATQILDEINAKKSFFIHLSHFTLEYILKNNIKLKYNYAQTQKEN